VRIVETREDLMPVGQHHISHQQTLSGTQNGQTKDEDEIFPQWTWRWKTRPSTVKEEDKLRSREAELQAVLIMQSEAMLVKI
jgi:hypothetical protein